MCRVRSCWSGCGMRTPTRSRTRCGWCSFTLRRKLGEPSPDRDRARRRLPDRLMRGSVRTRLVLAVVGIFGAAMALILGASYLLIAGHLRRTLPADEASAVLERPARAVRARGPRHDAAGDGRRAPRRAQTAGSTERDSRGRRAHEWRPTWRSGSRSAVLPMRCVSSATPSTQCSTACRRASPRSALHRERKP